jgi:hypothetical protein
VSAPGGYRAGQGSAGYAGHQEKPGAASSRRAAEHSGGISVSGFRRTVTIVFPAKAASRVYWQTERGKAWLIQMGILDYVPPSRLKSERSELVRFKYAEQLAWRADRRNLQNLARTFHDERPRLVNLLWDLGDQEALREQAKAGDGHAASALANIMEQTQTSGSRGT